MTAGPLAASGAEVADLGDRVAFWAAVAVALVFSQVWVMVLTGPGPQPVDPAVSASIRNYYYPFYVVVVWLGVSRYQAVGVAMLRAPMVLLLLAVVFASTFWSIDPQVTFRRCIAVLFTSLAGVVIAERFTWPKFLEVFATAFGIAVVLCFLMALLVPTYGKMVTEFPGAWRGVWGHKNLLGYNMSVAVAVFAASAILNPQRRWLWLAAMAGALVLILLSTSKTSLVSCLIGGCCIPLVATARRGRAGAVTATFMWVTALLGLAFMLYAAPNVLLALIGKDDTLTGRTRIWAAVMRQIAKAPLAGYGYGAVWDSTSLWGPLPWISKEQGFVIHEAHNTWLGVWLELGLIGLTVWVVLFVAVWVRAMLALYSRRSAYFALPFLVVFTLHTATESAALVQNDLIWLMFVAVAVKLALREPPIENATLEGAPARLWASA